MSARHPAPAPDELARRSSVETGADGKAVLADLSPRDDVVAVRIAVHGRAAQDFQLTTQLTFGKDAPAEYAISLEPPVRIAGRVVDGDVRGRLRGRRSSSGSRGRNLDPADPRFIPRRPDPHGGRRLVPDDGGPRGGLVVSPGRPVAGA